MKRALIVRTGAIGDVVETTGLIRALRAAEYCVDYITGDVPAQLLSGDEDINEIYILSGKKYMYLFKFAKSLAKNNYDIILNLQPSLRMKFLCWMIGAKEIVNYKKTYKYHAVENFFETGKRAIPELVLDKNIKLCIDENLKQRMKNMLDNKTRIVFNTGASSARQGRKWAIDNWIKLAELIYEKYDVQIIVIGSKEDEENASALLEKFPQIKSFAGKTSLKETAALISNTDIVISGDTGPLHISSAAGPVCIGLYGSCPVSRSGPYGEKHLTIQSELSCSPCDRKVCKYVKSEIDDTLCMRDIKPEDVMKLINIQMQKKMLI